MLERFHEQLKENFKGSLVQVREAEAIDANAKVYLNRMARGGRVERVTWGWYWIPDKHSDFFDFLAKDRHFKVLHKQSAAAVEGLEPTIVDCTKEWSFADAFACVRETSQKSTGERSRGASGNEQREAVFAWGRS